MRKILLLLLLILIFIGPKINAQTITAMTFNIRYDNPGDEKNAWEFRKESVAHLINHYNPQVVGIQEGLNSQVIFLNENLKSFNFVGVGRDDGIKKGEYCAIFYDTTKIMNIRNASFWLSDTPDSVSVGWDASMERICTFGLFRHINSGKDFWVFNTHFDHIGMRAQKKSAQLILRKINELNTNNLPIILMGDFNALPESEPVEIIKKQLAESSLVSKKSLYGPRGTFNNFISSNTTSNHIDYVFVSKFTVLSISHIDDKKNDNLCVSDHFPVLVELQF